MISVLYCPQVKREMCDWGSVLEWVLGHSVEGPSEKTKTLNCQNEHLIQMHRESFEDICFRELILEESWKLCSKYASYAKAMCSNRIPCRPGVPRKAEDKTSSPPQAALVHTQYNQQVALV